MIALCVPSHENGWCKIKSDGYYNNLLWYHYAMLEDYHGFRIHAASIAHFPRSPSLVRPLLHSRAPGKHLLETGSRPGARLWNWATPFCLFPCIPSCKASSRHPPTRHHLFSWRFGFAWELVVGDDCYSSDPQRPFVRKIGNISSCDEWPHYL